MTSRHPHSMTSAPRAHRGVSLIEVLIAVLILGIGMLGIAAMQAAALRNSQGSMQQSQAVIEANAMLDSMRANPSGAYNMAMGNSTCTAPTATGTLAQKDQKWFITTLQKDLGPNACGSIANCPTGTAANPCTVTVRWNDNGSNGAAKTVAAKVIRLQ